MMKKIMCVVGVGVLVVGMLGLMAQNPVKITTGEGVERVTGASGAEYNSGMTLVPDTLTAVTATTTKVQVIWCSNATSSAATLTLTDTAGLPYGTAVSITGNSIALIHNSLVGVPMVGIKWQAGTAKSLYCQIVGVQ